jgi:hypothetical protein
MTMLRASGSPWRRLAAIGLVTASLVLPASDGHAAPETVPLAPEPGCSAAGEAPAALRPGLVRADRAARPAPRRRQGAARRSPPPSPPLAEELSPKAMRAFYTCATPRMRAVPVGRGWLAVGPVQRG